MQPPKSDICVICGINPATTVEHVPPRGFFKGITADDFRTVPACRTCNNGGSKDDEQLRLYISAQIGKSTEGARLLWDKGAHKSILRSPQLRSTFLASLREASAILPSGENPNQLVFLIPTSLYQRVFERVTRGLFFWHTKAILPQDTLVKILLLNDCPDLSSPMSNHFTKCTVAEGAFEYRFGIDPEDKCNSFWLFGIHQAHWVCAMTGALTPSSQA